MSRTPRSTFLVLIAVLSLSPVWAQQKTTPIPDFSRAVDLTDHSLIQYQDYDKKLLTFTTKAQYVLVPAVVLDKDGNPVTGLKKEDFRLQENGKDQVISNVDEIIPITGPLNKTPASNANEASNELSIENRAPRRLVIIAIDMVNTPFLDQVRARQQVIRYLSDSLESDSLYQIVVIRNNGLRVLHDYTQSSTDLVATLQKVQSRFTPSDRVDTASLADFNSKGSVGATTGTPGATSVGPSGNSYTIDPRVDLEAFAAGADAAAEHPYAEFVAAAAAESTLTAFQQIAERVSGVPGRKSLIWITGGFPFSLDPATARFSSGVAFDIYQHVMQELNDQMIAVYPVDARGLLTSNVDASVHLTRTQNAFPGAMLADTSNRQNDILITMRAFADMTGGRAFVNTNDTTGAVHSAARDGSRYYLLSYPLDKNNRRQGWRKITVKAGNYHVRAREGYYMTQATANPSTSARYDVDAALKSPLDYTGIPLRILLKPQIAADGKRKLPFSTVISPTGITVDSTDNNHVFLDISYSVLTADGNSASKQDKSYNLNLNADQLKQFEAKGLGIGDTLDLAPGSYRLRVVVRDNLSGHIGSVLAEVRAD
ncbi:MAG TPA: VWA domain-containing protein [Candidatus Dormibacteraeota bacterium]|nr:VWA domain-containing protein [Candidatus Dormibacteraeota bacterium]